MPTTVNNPNTAPEYEQIKINTLSYGIEVKGIIPLYRNFGINIGWITFYQKLWNRPAFINESWRWYHSPEFELFYYPIKSNQDKIFLRFRTVVTTDAIERNFVQLQVGYKGRFNFNAK
ncbi:hypothetical protein [Xanthocytophaga agilis]|uniref:Uncharacterized protein n=1 Tax=Xanthocytophaga agilis TaxID=3048010 RepID=A0AAE3UJ49_9BACT|nr:hypothetical protein [Xanthocytophaga agilis]MDJ1505412.1 hypothetical protein [Xanthocytophaga agilis]